MGYEHYECVLHLARLLFIWVSDKPVVLFLWIISFMVIHWLWMGYSYFNPDGSSFNIYKTLECRVEYANLVMTPFLKCHYYLSHFKVYVVDSFWWILESLDYDLLTHTNCASMSKMPKTLRSGKTEHETNIVEYPTWWCVVLQRDSGYHYLVNFIVDLSK